MTTVDGGLQVGAAVPSLVRWGLSPDADLVYRALVTAGPRTSRWLAHDLGMVVRRVETAIDELAAVAAVETSKTRTTPEPRWRAAAPHVVHAALNRRRGMSVDVGDQIRRHRAIVGGATWSDGSSPAGLGVRYHEGNLSTRERIAQLMAAEQHEHLALNPEPSFTSEAMRAALPLVRQVYARGITVRTCGVPFPDSDPGSVASPGVGYREHPDIPVKLMIFDRRVALLPADPGNLSAGALEMDQPGVVEAMVALFEQVWCTAREPRKEGVPATVLTVREQAIIGLLANGHTDPSVAQHLGISRRTIAYTLRALMDRLGVENRFQLGLILGGAGAATPPSTRQEENA